MDKEIRLYSREELYGKGLDEVVRLFLERQEWEKEILSKYTEQSRELSNSLEENRLLKVKLFGRSTETSASFGQDEKTDDDAQASASPEAEEKHDGTVQASVSHGPDETDSSGEKKDDDSLDPGRRRPRRQKGCMQRQREGLPVIEINDVIEEEKLKELLGNGKVSELPPSGYDVIRMRPAFCYIEHHNVHVYKSGKKIVRASMTDKLIPHSDISSSTMAYLMNGRYVLNLPANRLSRELERNGYPMSRQRIYYLTEYFAFKVFELVIERMKQVMFSTGHIQADETEIVMNEKRKDGHVVRSRMWAYLTSERNESGLPKVVIYKFEQSRSTDMLEDFIKGFSGTITSDGYISYRSVDKNENIDVTATGCMTHNRRKYIDALKALAGFRHLKKEEKEQVPAYVASKKIGKIFSADKLLNSLEPDERLKRRRTEVAPLVDDFFDYIHSLKETDFMKGSLTYTAVTYSKNQEKYLRAFLSDGHIPLENSASERAIITIALGRNGWKTIATDDGATATGYMYSIAETAKRNKANPYYYYKYLLERTKGLLEEHKDDPITELSYLDPMMPWSEEYKAYEKAEHEKDYSVVQQLIRTENTQNAKNS